MEDANKLGIQAFHTWKDWFKAKNLYSSDNDPNDHPIAWHPLSVGWVKCNVDAGFNNQKGITNRGGVLEIVVVVPSMSE